MQVSDKGVVSLEALGKCVTSPYLAYWNWDTGCCGVDLQDGWARRQRSLITMSICVEQPPGRRRRRTVLVDAAGTGLRAELLPTICNFRGGSFDGGRDPLAVLTGDGAEARLLGTADGVDIVRDWLDSIFALAAVINGGGGGKSGWCEKRQLGRVHVAFSGQETVWNSWSDENMVVKDADA